MFKKSFKILTVGSALCLSIVLGYCLLLSQEKEPKRFLLDFVDAYLIYQPASNTLQIATEGNVLSYGTDWDKCKMKPYLYHLRKKSWKDFYWKVNTSRKEVYMVTEGTFCQFGGNERKLNFAVDVVGGAGDTEPDRFFIRFGNYGAYLVYEPSSNTLQIAAVTTPGGGVVLSYGEDWQRCKVYPYLYHLKQNFWKDFHWKINTSRKGAWRTKGGTFCKVGGSDTSLKMRVRVVE